MTLCLLSKPAGVMDIQNRHGIWTYVFHREWDETKSLLKGYTWGQAPLGVASLLPLQSGLP